MTTPPKPPKHLKRSGRDLFRDIVTEYSITDAGGLALLTTACECLDRIREAQEVIEKEGALDRDRYGATRTNPACILERDARAQFLQAMKSLNLDLEPLRDRPGRPPGDPRLRRNDGTSRGSASTTSSVTPITQR